MAHEDFTVGDMVWAKMRSYPPWPAQIADPSSTTVKPPKNKKAHFVFFFGTKDYAWITDENISHHSEEFYNNLNKKKSAPYQNAIDAFNSCLKKKPSAVKKEKIQSNEVSPMTRPATVTKKRPRSGRTVQKSPAKTLKVSHNDEASGSHSESSPKSLKFQNNYSAVGNSSCSDSFHPWGATSHMFYETISPASPHIVGKKNVKPSHKRIGFIGLGHMGRSIVRNMIKSGHRVTVWNRTLYKCDEFVRLGAKKAASAADLMIQCDATFSCVSDPEASKALIFGEQGILQGLEHAEELGFERRGYVELSTLDVKTSKAIHEAITMKHGLYLEAPLIGTRRDAERGSLFIIASGSRRLFSELESCFHSIGRCVLYQECDVGYSAKISLICKTVASVSAMAMAEMLVMGERLGLPGKQLMEILCDGPFSPDSMNKVARKMMLSKTPPVIADFKETKKNLEHLMKAADQFSQRLPLASAANEVYSNPNML